MSDSYTGDKSIKFSSSGPYYPGVTIKCPVQSIHGLTSGGTYVISTMFKRFNIDSYGSTWPGRSQGIFNFATYAFSYTGYVDRKSGDFLNEPYASYNGAAYGLGQNNALNALNTWIAVDVYIDSNGLKCYVNNQLNGELSNSWSNIFGDTFAISGAYNLTLDYLKIYKFV